MAIDIVLAKLNTRSLGLVVGAALVGAGIYMCLAQLHATGSIDLKSPFISGRMETGSLGLFVILLGVVVVLGVVAAARRAAERRPERIELTHGETRVVCENISYRKVQEIRALLEGGDGLAASAHRSLSDPPPGADAESDG